MSLQFEAADTVFDNAKMADDSGSDEASTPKKRDGVAGVTEVGVEKSACGRPSESRRVEFLRRTST